MPKLITALLVKDEAGKYLDRVLRRCREFSDEVLVLDDNSTDNSTEIAKSLGCKVQPLSGPGMWGNEAPARALLWDWGAKEAGDGWLLICDADMVLMGDPRPLTYTKVYNSWAFVLFDMWSPNEYRTDGFWQGHKHPRPWLFRPSAMGEQTPIWPERGLHTGHCPLNYPYSTGILDHSQLAWLHLAYATPEHRLQKYQQYMAKKDQLSEFETAHASSILGPSDWLNLQSPPMSPSTL